MRYLATDGETYPANDGDRIQFQQGVRAALECSAVADGTDFEPEVLLTMNGKDVTAQFTKQVKPSRVDDDGLLQLTVKVTYELKMDSADASRHGKNVTCRASMPHHPSLYTSVGIEVACK